MSCVLSYYIHELEFMQVLYIVASFPDPILELKRGSSTYV